MTDVPRTIPADDGPKLPEETASDRIANAIRNESAEFRLISLSRLRERFPDTAIDGMFQTSPDLYSDIQWIAGGADTYYFSSLAMTRSYATHLARVEDHDPLILIAETVRDESRGYTRPTALTSFLGPPFFISDADIASLLHRLRRSPDFRDIRTCTASNGAVYLYSAYYLTDTHARKLTEYYEVELWRNP